MKRVSDTRWSARADSVLALKKSYIEIKAALSDASKNATQKPVAKAEAKALVKQMERYEIALMTVLWNMLLQRIDATSKSLQDQKLCLSKAAELLNSLTLFFKNVRENFAKIETEAKFLLGIENDHNIAYEDKQTQRRQTKRTLFFDETADNDVILKGREKFIVGTLNVVCDRLVVELGNRLKAYEDINSRFGLFFGHDQPNNGNNTHMITNLMDTYKDDIDCDIFEDELAQFLILAKNESITNPIDMYQLVVRGLQSTFPNVETILRIYLTIPISNASGERSFSVLKGVKNCIRSSIEQDRLGSLALLCIESAETKKANFDQQIDIFARLKCRKKAL